MATMFTQIKLLSRRAVIALLMLPFAALMASSTMAQSSTADIIAPVGQVCLAGEPCVGQPASGASTATASSATSAPAPAAAPAADTPAAAPAETDFDVAAAYNQSCMACHTTGAAGAPKIGDAAAWETRLEKGMDAVMNNVLNGINAMPARGLCMSCSDDQLAALVDYMISQ